MKENKTILLSADAEVALYQVSEEIWSNFDKLIKVFFKWKKTKQYDETLFVKFLRNLYGEKSIAFITIVGNYSGSPDKIFQNGKDVTEQYKGVKWFNF